jgi:hypothetical protein
MFSPSARPQAGEGLRVVPLSPGQGTKDYGKKPVDTLDNQIAQFIIVTARSSP